MGLIDGGIGLLLFGILILVGGIVVSSYIRSEAVPCDEWYGQLGQFLDSQTRQHCQQANMLQAESSAATIIGMITGVLGIVCVGVGLAGRIKSQTISKPVN
jgi:ABC-type antimicrobial peptide transport system permease subunit